MSNLRLRCRAHNQYEAERAYGAEFMRHKRQAAGEARSAARAQAKPDSSRDVVPWLRALGFRAEQARAAAAFCEHMHDATLEERVKVALRHVRVRGTKVIPAWAEAPAGTPAQAPPG